MDDPSFSAWGQAAMRPRSWHRPLAVWLRANFRSATLNGILER